MWYELVLVFDTRWFVGRWIYISLHPFSTAGYNNLEGSGVVLLEHGADVNAQDKGGLIPLHNAASYGVSAIAD